MENKSELLSPENMASRFQIENLGFVLCAWDETHVIINADGLPYPYAVLFDMTDMAQVAKYHTLINFFNSGAYKEPGHRAYISGDPVSSDGDNTIPAKDVVFFFDYFE